MTPHLSIVSPVYQSEKIVSKLVVEIEANVKTITDNYEIILVEDGSRDNSWQEISKLCNIKQNLIGLKLSRNFGQHYAITAGLELAKGDWIVVMDCDLQDRPDQIPKLYHKAIEGFEMVFARRAIRHDSRIKKKSSKLFYGIFSYLTDTKQDPAIANFGIYSKKSIKSILAMKDNIRYFPTMMQWVGFKKTTLDVLHSNRQIGKTSYSFKKLLSLAIDNIIAFSDKPLRLTIKLGFFISLTAASIGIIYLIAYISGDIIVAGFTSLIISISFFSGLIIFFLGMIGIYIGKIFDKVKDRPTYIIDEIIKSNAK